MKTTLESGEQGPRVHVWTADISFDAALAARLIRAQFAQFQDSAIEPFGIGWDNAAFLVDGRTVFRFPRRKAVATLIEREVAILPTVAASLPLRISAPQYVGKPSDEYPFAWAGYERIDGATACSVALSDATRAALGPPLGAFLRALHAIDPVPSVAAGLPGDEIGRMNHRLRMPKANERVAFLESAGVLEGGDAYLAWLEANPPVPRDDHQLRLVHGDLYARHVLVDADGSATGVIDWGDMHLGDPAIDLAIAFLLLPPNAHDEFRAAYGPIGDATWTAARYRAIYHAILELDYGVHENDAGMRESGQTALRFLEESL